MILVTGATGYVGGRLVAAFERQDVPVRCLARRPEHLLARVRGFLDLLAGGVGHRRARRDPDVLRVGDTLDWWRVEAYEPNRLLRLWAEMKVPGRAWLEFEVTPDGDGSIVRQTALFDPVGLGGLAYWWLVYPLHQLVFRGMLRAIAREAVGPRARVGDAAA